FTCTATHLAVFTRTPVGLSVLAGRAQRHLAAKTDRGFFAWLGIGLVAALDAFAINLACEKLGHAGRTRRGTIGKAMGGAERFGAGITLGEDHRSQVVLGCLFLPSRHAVLLQTRTHTARFRAELASNLFLLLGFVGVVLLELFIHNRVTSFCAACLETTMTNETNK